MDDDAEQAKRFGALEFVDERRNRLLTQDGERRREIDQVTGVRDDRCDPGFANALPKQACFRSVERPRAPLVRILGEDLQRLAAMNDRTIDGPGHAAGH